jgi:phosphomannomutase
MNFTKQYTEFLRSFLKITAPVRIVVDSSDGTTGPIIGDLLEKERLIEYHLINGSPNGDFPGHGPDFLAKGAMDTLRREVLTRGADLGIVFDGDGDRVMFLDGAGEAINPYDVVRCLKDFFDPPYILDVRALADFTMPGVKVVEEKVGYYHIRRTMRKMNLSFGAEFSGHYYFRDFFFCDSGILAAVFMLNFVAGLKESSRSLGEEVKKLSSLRWAPPLDLQIGDGEGALRRVEEFYGKDSSIRISKLDGISVVAEDFAFNVRPSNTEDLMRLTMVAKHGKALDEKLAELKKIIGVV